MTALATADQEARVLADHDVTITYTVDDDGIWLRCRCGWKALLGFDPTLDRAMDVGFDHYRGARSRRDR